jgi:hypothetical protein
MGFPLELFWVKPMTYAEQHHLIVSPAAADERAGRVDQQRDETPPGPEIAVVYTTEAGTRTALVRAWQLARDLGARVRLVHIYAVPYALPLTAPGVSLSFVADCLAELACHAPGETSIHIYLCRDRARALEEVLPRSSVVVLGGSVRWWPTQEQRLARKLLDSGREVIFTESGGRSA